jgi:hypothetical protein
MKLSILEVLIGFGLKEVLCIWFVPYNKGSPLLLHFDFHQNCILFVRKYLIYCILLLYTCLSKCFLKVYFIWPDTKWLNKWRVGFLENLKCDILCHKQMTFVELTKMLTSHWQTLSHNVVHLALIEIRTHNISGNSHTIMATTAPLLI